VREPVQVYLDPEDRALLLDIAQRTATSQAEVLRRGLRRMAGEVADHPPGASLDVLTDSLQGVEGVPSDLAARHDEYLYPMDPSYESRRR
jgi:hypothetical protein